MGLPVKPLTVVTPSLLAASAVCTISFAARWRTPSGSRAASAGSAYWISCILTDLFSGGRRDHRSAAARDPPAREGQAIW